MFILTLVAMVVDATVTILAVVVVMVEVVVVVTNWKKKMLIIIRAADTHLSIYATDCLYNFGTSGTSN